MEEQTSTSEYLHGESDIVLEGWMLKLSRVKQWQKRYFVFSQDQLLSYRHKKDEPNPRAAFRISREARCEISDIYVQQRQNGSEKESLYCLNLSWPDNAGTVASVNRYNDSFRDDLSVVGAPTTGSENPSPIPSRGRKSPRSKSFKSPFRKKQSVGTSSASVDRLGRSLSPSRDLSRKESEDQSIASQTSSKMKIYRSSHSWGGVFANSSGSMEASLQNLEFESLGSVNSTSKKEKKYSKRKGESGGVPSIVQMGGSSVQEYETIVEGDDEKSPAKVPNRLSSATETPRHEAKPESTTFDPKAQGQGNYMGKNATEQEKLLGQYLYNKRAKEKASRKKVVEGAKIAAAAGAAIGVGVLTAGVGIATGLVFLGAALTAGGTAGVAEAGLKRKYYKGGKLTIATISYEQAKLWKSSLDACLEVESLKESTWGQMFVAEGHRTESALMPRDVELLSVLSHEGASPTNDSAHLKSLDLPKGQSNLFLRNRNFLMGTSTNWCPLEGGWTSLLGPGAKSLRIFREEKRHDSREVGGLAVEGSTCTPLKTQAVLKAQPLDAFMCLMSFARMDPSLSKNDLFPNSGQTASFQVVEKINEHMDIIHLVSRKLYLFPSWTVPRDFVLLRYWRYESDGSYIICYESLEHPSCPPIPAYVRGEMHQVHTIAPPKTLDPRRKSSLSVVSECLLTTVVQVDPKGWVPSRSVPFLSNQTYSDAFGILALLQVLDVRDAIDCDRFLDLSPDLNQSTPTKGRYGNGASRDSRDASFGDLVNYDVRYANRERRDSSSFDTLSGLECSPPPLKSEKWAEPDANSFLVRGPTYKQDRKKINAGTSIGRLVAVDLVGVDKHIYSGMSVHPKERIQQALEKERKLKQLGKECDMPPFIFVVNIILPGPPFYHGVYYYAVDDMSTIDGTNGTASSKLCNKFLFGDSDEFRDRTFKLIPQIVEGNFMVRKAVGSTPAIMGTKLRQLYVRNDRFMEVILDCSSSQVATGVIRLSLGYAKSLMVDMGFLLEGDTGEVLPERIFGCVRMKYPEFGAVLRKVEQP